MSRPPATSLSADPRIESVELRRELARRRARSQLGACIVVVLALGVAGWQISDVFAIPLLIATAALGVAWDRWQSALADDERIEQDLRALTAVYHESPLTLRKWLTLDFLLDSIRNLLAAALESEELAHGYHKQAVKQFIAESHRGFKSNWRYQIDLVDLERDVVLIEKDEDKDDPGLALPRTRYRRLHTSVSYVQLVPEPPELYYVAVVFEGKELPDWFKKPNFLLREVVVVPEPLIARLPAGQVTNLPDDYDPESSANLIEDPVVASLAERVLEAHVHIGEQELTAISLRADHTSISLGFRLTPELQDRLRASAEISVDLKTYTSRAQHNFPVMMATPTRHPMVQFNYSQTDIDAVETQVFFSAERPWDARLRTSSEEVRRVDVLTEPDDWVFVGSGCIFMWAPPPTDDAPQ